MATRRPGSTDPRWRAGVHAGPVPTGGSSPDASRALLPQLRRHPRCGIMHTQCRPQPAEARPCHPRSRSSSPAPERAPRTRARAARCGTHGRRRRHDGPGRKCRELHRLRAPQAARSVVEAGRVAGRRPGRHVATDSPRPRRPGRHARRMTPGRATLAAVSDEFRPWHLTACPARDAAVTLEACTCPPERWLDAFARPVPEAGEDER